MANGIDYQAVLADLKAKRDALDEAIRVLEGVASISTGGNITPRGEVTTAVIRSDTFYGSSVPQGTLRYLGMTSRTPKQPTEIVEALKGGGIETANYTNVYTALKRLRASGEVVKLPSGEWGLAEWYPGARRPKRAKNEDLDEGEDQADGKDEESEGGAD